MNVIEKILLDHCDDKSVAYVGPGDIVSVSVDKVIILDIAGQHPELINNPPNMVFDHDKVSFFFDHFVPAPNVEMASGTSKIRELVRRLGITSFYDYGHGEIGSVLSD